MNFKKKLNKKKKDILQRSESEKKILYIGHPFIDKNSR